MQQRKISRKNPRDISFLEEVFFTKNRIVECLAHLSFSACVFHVFRSSGHEV